MTRGCLVLRTSELQNEVKFLLFRFLFFSPGCLIIPSVAYPLPITVPPCCPVCDNLWVIKICKGILVRQYVRQILDVFI